MKPVAIGSVVLELGMVVATRRAVGQLDKLDAMDALTRHVIGDWGEIDTDAWQSNENALKSSERVVSSYLDRKNRRFMVITEADRAKKTILLPDEA